MKKLSMLDKLLFVLNSLLAALLLLSYLSYYISPNMLSFISLVSLAIPVLIALNFVFALYWIVKLKKQFLLSTLVLVIGFQYITKLYTFNEKKILLQNDLKIMSYNVKMFNLYKWIDDKGIDDKIYDFVNSNKPDILCIQEYHESLKKGLKFPYKYVKITSPNNHFGHAIFSNYKIVNSGSLNFSNTGNNAIFADIVKNNDTIRVYNIHLESLKLNPKDDYFNQDNSQKFKNRVEKAFKIQANQAKLIKLHQEKTTLKSIICGDFNNTAFSWVYHQLKEGKNDAFEVAGSGFGKTFDHILPIRIDFILIDKTIEINYYKSYNIKFSDHFPIMARLKF